MDKMKKIVKENYHVDIENIVKQKGGWASLAYKVFDRNQSYFLKVYEKRRASTPNLTALIDKYVPIMVWILNNTRLKGKISVPFITRDGGYKCEDEDGIYLLYDYIDGETIGDRDLRGDQVHQLAEIITELHLYGEEIPIETATIKEDFAVPFLEALRDILNKKMNNFPSDVKELINPHVNQINDLIHTIEKLSVRLKNSEVRMVLCHTDLHYWNLMESGKQLMLIDWEGLKLAPVEADLMFLVDKPYFNQFINIYQKTHSNFSINPDALQFYLGRRKLEDLWEFFEQLLFDEQNEQERIMTMNYLKETLSTIGQ
ncbi:aminoglycoside phosphotransferase family protein [Pseudogracilibacillus auburnensis]|uniref:aminoglycoside phosphotransferase family protein n=1 Tax=Pseudogracilibacillus auburnensis TaxID=1494959 RepID=UPI001A9598F5|nr:aminoglycoside phosphotransferase family protein [Pseudogracilibacillus auburnensis]MBO1001221.1 aminoglycoside phosphotransferase family protein [Pseudogracilibacillus auburnensis]